MGEWRILDKLKDNVYPEFTRWLRVMHPGYANVFIDHFNRLNLDDWTITTVEAGAGSASEVITGEQGGVLLITNDAADDDSDEFQLPGEAFKLESGKPLYFEARFKVSDADQSDCIMGLCITDTTLLGGMTDGVYFISDDGDANIDFVTEKDSTETKTDTGVDLSDATYVVVGFHWDGVASVTPYIGTDPSNLTAYTAHNANIPDDEELTVSFGIRNGEAVAKTMSVDYILCAQLMNLS